MELSATIEAFRRYLDEKLAYYRTVELMGWDQSTGAPKAGAHSRSKTRGIIAAKEFAMTTSPDMAGFLDTLGSHTGELDAVTLGLYKKCRREYDALVKIPVEEYRAYAELIGISGAVWEEAKEKSDFAMFAPYLRDVTAYQRAFAAYRSRGGHPYDALLDDYEPGMTVAGLDEYFKTLKAFIVPFLRRIMTDGRSIRSDFLHRHASMAVQRDISEMLIGKLEYDLTRGMLKESEHPFTCSFGKNDVRITTHYHEDNVLSSFYSVIHEAGHALYEQNVMDELEGTFMGEGVSMGMHESQSRFYENVVGRSKEFWAGIYGDLKPLLGSAFDDVTEEELYRASNIVQPGLIRIEADELTYSLHIMVRYEMEKLLLEGDVDVNSLPGIWNDKYEEYIGLRPGNDAEGILQDVHWSEGLFGYFPSYSLGSAYAAQMLNYMRRDIDVFALVRDGRMGAVNEWLKDNIHRHGSLKTPAELMTAMGGEELNAKYYVDYLRGKYAALYGVSAE